MAMKNVKYEIVKHIGVISKKRSYQKEVNLISWNGRPPVIDIRNMHLRNIGMSAAMRCQYPHFRNPFKGLLELVPKVRRVAGHIPFTGLPNKLIGSIRQEAGTVSNCHRNRDRSITVIRFGCANRNPSLLHYRRLLNRNLRSVFGDMPGFQSKEFLGSHSGCQHQTNAPTYPILWKQKITGTRK